MAATIRPHTCHMSSVTPPNCLPRSLDVSPASVESPDHVSDTTTFECFSSRHITSHTVLTGSVKGIFQERTSKPVSELFCTPTICSDVS